MCSLKLAAISNMDLPEEAHQPLNGCGKWCGKDCGHFSGVNSNEMFAHDMSEYSATGYYECTLGGIEFEGCFATVLQEMVQELEVMGCGTEDGKVIQNYLHELRNEFINYFHNGVLESSWCRLPLLRIHTSR